MERERILAAYPDLAGLKQDGLRAEWDRLNALPNRDDPEVKDRRHSISTLLFLMRRS